MKKFNQSIKIEVSVDSIAQQLLSNFQPDFKHAELVTEALIGRMLTADMPALSHLYNSLNGFTNDINFIVGEIVNVEDFTAYGYWNEVTEEEKTVLKPDYKAVTKVTIIKIDKYADKSLLIEFSVPNKSGEFETKTEWVRHTRCSKLA